MNVKNTQVTVVGLARSGVAAARLLQAAGAHVTVADRKERSELSAVLAQLDAAHVGITVGSGYETALESAELVVISPGVPYRMEALERVRRRGSAARGIALHLARGGCGFVVSRYGIGLVAVCLRLGCACSDRVSLANQLQQSQLHLHRVCRLLNQKLGNEEPGITTIYGLSLGILLPERGQASPRSVSVLNIILVINYRIIFERIFDCFTFYDY